MKDVLISGARIKKELITLLIFFLIGFFANVGAIIYYKTVFTEIVSSLGYIVVFTFVSYFVWSLLRILTWLLLNFIKKASSR